MPRGQSSPHTLFSRAIKADRTELGWDIVIEEIIGDGSAKLGVIKAIRKTTNFGLKMAKQATDEMPCYLGLSKSKGEIEEISKVLQESNNLKFRVIKNKVEPLEKRADWVIGYPSINMILKDEDVRPIVLNFLEEKGINKSPQELGQMVLNQENLIIEKDLPWDLAWRKMSKVHIRLFKNKRVGVASFATLEACGESFRSFHDKSTSVEKD